MRVNPQVKLVFKPNSFMIETNDHGVFEKLKRDPDISSARLDSKGMHAFLSFFLANLTHATVDV